MISDRPPTPPSASAEVDREENFVRSIKVLLTDPNFWVLLIGFGIGLGAYNTLATVLNEVLEPEKYTNVRNFIENSIFFCHYNNMKNS